ncbi:alpha/beta fold hydrolase [Amycolatopsis echigonensis]|uniref:Alpha/beta hydrolase n=1 Tax=Amycolatopsis echigonensis TaxID=2576905 RepID=A0A2N3WV43_9PSEU|nr:MULTISPECIES: alpha/beta hydrolase [Amycolatopsis]MBB2497573.1 alpha/beta hydrolase [Amycolatopsis echigonensis]PKV97750.1 pimeloyl-ACP methyl ester carboxylesterase [Amycolatopsis niigatensis]
MDAVRQVEANGVRLNVAVAGSGPALVLLHGFPHTWQLWSAVLPTLAERYRVLAPDLRGLGASSRPESGFDAGTVVADVTSLLDALGEPDADVVAIDLSVQSALLLALRQPERVRRLVLMESLPWGFPAGPPWWFGFHAVPGLAETVLNGHEAEYVGWFLDQGTLGRGVPAEVQAAFAEAYTGTGALRCAFEHYRAMPESVRQLTEAAEKRLTVPTMAIGAHPVGDALEQQLRPIADDLAGRVLPDCGHLIPLDRPRAFLDLLLPFLSREILAGCR